MTPAESYVVARLTRLGYENHGFVVRPVGRWIVMTRPADGATVEVRETAPNRVEVDETVAPPRPPFTGDIPF